MPSLGFAELVVIGIVLLVVVGPERLPHATRTIGRLYGQMRRAADELRRALVLEADRLDEEERLKELRKRRQEAMERSRREAEARAGEGTAAQEQELPPERAPDDAPAAEPLPPGFTADEWAELPDHVKAIVRRRSQGA